MSSIEVQDVIKSAMVVYVRKYIADVVSVTDWDEDIFVTDSEFGPVYDALTTIYYTTESGSGHRTFPGRFYGIIEDIRSQKVDIEEK